MSIHVGVARAADVAVLGVSQNSQASTRILRIPATGSFTGIAATGDYLTVGVAISDAAFSVEKVIWLEEGLQLSRALNFQVAREEVEGAIGCRIELWGAPAIRAARGHFEVTVVPEAGNPPAPSLAATVIAFSNVAATTTNGPCCGEASNGNSGVSTISKTMYGTSRGDVLVNAVCTSWTGAAPGSPTNDPAVDPEMVPRTFQSVAGRNLQQFSGTSPGPNVVRPATSYRHLRWLQSGSRAWALVGLGLLATDGPAAPPDASPPPVDMGVDMGTSPADASVPGPMDMAPPAPDVGGGGGASAGDVGGDSAQTGGAGGAGASDGSLPDGPSPSPDGDGRRTVTPRQLDWRVGCACEVGAGTSGGGPGVVVLLLALLRRAARRRLRRG